MTIDEMVRLIEAVSENGLTSFAFEEGNQKLVLKKKAQPVVKVPVSAGIPVLSGAEPVVEEEIPAPARAKADSGAGIGSDNVVTSPLVGTFYSAASPEAEAFVKAGDHVKKGQVLGIIEAMKLMNEIESEWDGVVEAVLVNNEDVVEYGQPLFRIR